MIDVRYISVILPLKIEWEPCYSLPMDVEDLSAGDRVKVRFANKVYIGVVSAIGVTPDIDPKRILPIVSHEKNLEKVRAEEIELWRHVAGYYLCSIGEVYKAAYPISKTNLEEARAAALQKARDRREKLLEAMRAKAAKLQDRKMRKEEQLAKVSKGTKAEAKYAVELHHIMADLAKAQEALGALGALGAATIITAAGTQTESQHGASATSPTSPTVSLSEAQTAAYEKIRDAFQKGKPALLHGVTGSGKTEIYIKLAQEAMSEGKNVLYLVPEIALSRQLEDRLYEHFGERLMTFHSAETAASKRATAEIIRSYRESSGSYIVLGTRSSLFLPHNNLGLIIVDEEHDSSYKQDSPAPRYNGRDTALMFSVIHRCRIILGSATPSLEEMYNCLSGKHQLVELKERFHGSGSARIEIIDTKAERRKRGMEGNFSRKLIEHIKSTIDAGGQVMILRSRRAWSPALQCEHCGDIPKCTHCNVSLTYHKDGRMICHYCGHTESFTGLCSKCGGQLKGLGAGTQKIEEEAATLFPQARIARLDSDTAQNKSYETKTIREFSQGRIDILIGTQMLTKGFDFSNLRLVAVIAADTMLGMQDFRADEKAMQLLEQFRGRCGRRDAEGLCVIQTSQPEHPVYKFLTENKATDENMLQERHDFNFPPYTRIIEVTIRDNFEDRATRMATALAENIRTALGAKGKGIGLASGPVTGPYTPVIDKIADQHIRTIRISLRKDKGLKPSKDAIAKTIQTFEKEKKYPNHITIDVDPA